MQILLSTPLMNLSSLFLTKIFLFITGCCEKDQSVRDQISFREILVEIIKLIHYWYYKIATSLPSLFWNWQENHALLGANFEYSWNVPKSNKRRKRQKTSGTEKKSFIQQRQTFSTFGRFSMDIIGQFEDAKRETPLAMLLTKFHSDVFPLDCRIKKANFHSKYCS